MTDALSRRDFLNRSAAVGLGSALAWNWPDVVSAASDKSAAVTPAGEPLVVRIRSDYVIVNGRVHPKVLGEMLDAGLQAASGSDSPQEAWRLLLGDSARIAIKFDSGVDPASAAELTQSALANTILKSLTGAGYSSQNLVAIGISAATQEAFGLQPQTASWSDTPVELSAGPDRIAAILEQVDGLINVPKLRRNDVSGMAGCLYNVSLPLVEHPARHFANGCSPSIAEIAALDPIRSKLRFNIVDALWLAAIAPQANTSTDQPAPAGTLVMGIDPVATDAIGYEMLSANPRSLAAQPTRPAMPKHLQDAHAIGLGSADLHKIRLEKIIL